MNLEKRTIRRLSVIVVACASAMALAGCGSSGSSGAGGSSGTVRVALNTSADSLPLVVADKEGFFKKQGISFEGKPVVNVSDIPSLLGKQFDIGFTTAPVLITASSSGLDTVAIAGGSGDEPGKSPEYQLFVRKGIDSAADLKGARIGQITTNGNLALATSNWLDKEGVDWQSVHYVQTAFGNMTDQLLAGRLDAALMIPPFNTVAEEKGLKSLGDPETAISNDFINSTYWISTKKWATANADTVKKFLAAVQEAIDWIPAHEEDAYKILADFTGVTLENAKKVPIGHYSNDVAEIDTWGALLKKYGNFTKDVDYESLKFQP